MNIKSHIKLPLFCIFILFALDRQPCKAMGGEFRKTQEDLMRQAQMQIDNMPEESRHIQRKILTDTRDKIEEPAGRSASPLRPIKERIDLLLAKEKINPEEIDAVRQELEKVAQSQSSGIDRSELANLREKLDIAYGFTKTINELQTDQDVLVKKMNNNFEKVADNNDKATFWKNIFSGGFTISFIANFIAFFGLLIKVPDAKLERKLKQLLIIEKKAKLEHDGISLQQYS